MNRRQLFQSVVAVALVGVLARPVIYSDGLNDDAPGLNAFLQRLPVENRSRANMNYDCSYADNDWRTVISNGYFTLKSPLVIPEGTLLANNEFLMGDKGVIVLNESRTCVAYNRSYSIRRRIPLIQSTRV